MRDFSPDNPFPLWGDYGPGLYSAAKKHASEVDEWLGIDVEKIEAKIENPKDGEERWLGKPSGSWLTPYVEIRAFLEDVKPTPGQRVVDLGAGYGRLGFVLARHFPEVFFAGYELVQERVRAGEAALERFSAKNARLMSANIALPSWKLPEGEIYFIYDFGARESIAKVLEKLKDRARTEAFRVIGRGRGIRDQIERNHPWLGSVYEPVHGPHVSIYRNFG